MRLGQDLSDHQSFNRQARDNSEQDSKRDSEPVREASFDELPDDEDLEKAHIRRGRVRRVGGLQHEDDRYREHRVCAAGLKPSDHPSNDPSR